jgi:hypothetical protein
MCPRRSEEDAEPGFASWNQLVVTASDVSGFLSLRVKSTAAGYEILERFHEAAFYRAQAEAFGKPSWNRNCLWKSSGG